MPDRDGGRIGTGDRLSRGGGWGMNGSIGVEGFGLRVESFEAS